MLVLVFSSTKGGVGKSTVSANFAVEGIQANKKVLLVDIDPQNTTSKWGKRRKMEDPIVVSCTSGRLEQILGTAEEQGIDLVIIDCPPHSAEASLRAMSYASLVVILTTTDSVDYESLPNTLNLVQIAEKQRKERLRITVLFNKNHSSLGRFYRTSKVIKEMGIEVLSNPIYERIIFSDAHAYGMGVSEMGESKALDNIRIVFKEVMRYAEA